ncbi:amidohydrolase family protein [Membranihabitans marinus]|uniref:amidohydrolase family protein n=1 Tax=Membranihabitans marinus TaxID=1227546 RepID=UPI001F1B9785|nr:amidohydrolase family protein [Membranihabitans marinus]
MDIVRFYLYVALLSSSVISLDCVGQNSSELFIKNNEYNFSDSLLPYVKFKDNVQIFTHGKIIDGSGKSILEDQTLIIENGLIKEFGSSNDIKLLDLSADEAGGVEVVNLRGKTIIPGIIGMHNHLHIPQFPNLGEVAAKLYLASGVTTIQTCGATDSDAELLLSEQIKSGQKLGPEIIPSAPFITGEGGNPNMIIPKDEQHLRDTMLYWIDRGIKWFKVYRNINPKDLKTVIDLAHDHGGKVRGHMCSLTFEQASNLGIDGIEHGLNSASDFRTDKDYGICNGGREYMDELVINSSEVVNLQKTMIKNHVFLTSTLAIFESSIPNRSYANKESLISMSPYLKSQYEARRNDFNDEIKDSTRNQRFKRIMEFEYQFFKMGGLLCSGVDAGRHILPGFGDQRNFILHRETGFTTEEAIQIMTANGAKALGRTDIGSIQIGKRADFIILDGDLQDNPNVINKVETVFKNGIGYDPKKILNSIKGGFGRE